MYNTVLGGIFKNTAAERSSDKVRSRGLACTNRVLGTDIEQKSVKRD